ncbi:MAG: hypothetical protein KGL93_04085 [Gemmatimonadota bacterium]|nr:hypothetical protein [Gemmatimonadota bacterium]
MRGLACVTACVLWGVGAVAARAQQVPAAVSCHGQRIDAVDITSRAPSVAGVRGVPLVADIARAVHVTTKPDVISRFLLLQPGDPCSLTRIRESERILRAQPFLADATITVLPSDSGRVRLEVQTIDEVAAVFSATMKAKAPVLTGLRLGEANAGGQGVYVAGRWWKEDALRDGFAFRATDYQFLGRPYQATASAARNPLGGDYHFDIQRPFLTDLQRVAWRVQRGEADDYIRFVDGARVVHADRLSRNYADVGGVARIGAPGRLALVGFSVSRESEYAGDAPVLLTPQGTRPDSAFPLDGRYASLSTARVNALLGYRNLKYVRTRGFDGLRNVQDIPVGIQIGTLFGKSAAFLGSHDRDMLVGADLYAAQATRTSALRLQVEGEARRAADSSQWDGVIGSGRLARYQRIGQSQLFLTSLEWGGGWRVRVPFRMTLAGTEGGVRGMAEGIEQGGRRAVLRLEERMTLGTPLDGTADFGVAFFADAGKLWAGDVPFGTTTPVRYSAGVSLLAAVPSRSARMWRLDVAFPNVPGRGVRLALRLSHSDESLGFWNEPRDVALARQRSVPTSLFNWP